MNRCIFWNNVQKFVGFYFKGRCFIWWCYYFWNSSPLDYISFGQPLLIMSSSEKRSWPSVEKLLCCSVTKATRLLFVFTVPIGHSYSLSIPCAVAFCGKIQRQVLWEDIRWSGEPLQKNDHVLTVTFVQTAVIWTCLNLNTDESEVKSSTSAQIKAHKNGSGWGLAQPHCQARGIR